MTRDPATTVSWDSYVALRRSATMASARVQGQTVTERPGVISTASLRTEAAAGSVFVYADPGGDGFRSFVRSIRPSYLEIADDTGTAMEVLQDEGWHPTRELAVMGMTADAVIHEAPPPEVSVGAMTMASPDDRAALGSLLAAVEDIPVQAAVRYCTELGELDDLRLTVARDAEGRAVGSAGVRVFGGLGVVMLVQTHPAHRRRGIAGALCSHAIRDSGVHTAFLVATGSGRGVYERVGFRTIRPMQELLPPDGD